MELVGDSAEDVGLGAFLNCGSRSILLWPLYRSRMGICQ